MIHQKSRNYLPAILLFGEPKLVFCLFNNISEHTEKFYKKYNNIVVTFTERSSKYRFYYFSGCNYKLVGVLEEQAIDDVGIEQHIKAYAETLNRVHK